MTIAAYCRVSTIRQKADSQIAEIGKWLKANGYDGLNAIWQFNRLFGLSLPLRT